MQTLKYSSVSPQTARVKPRKREPRKTVGITLPPKLIEEVRKKGLNISRICEEALKSVLEYLPSQNKNENSKYFLDKPFFPNGQRARSSAWLERQAHNLLVAGSNPAGPTIQHYLQSSLTPFNYCFNFGIGNNEES